MFKLNQGRGDLEMDCSVDFTVCSPVTPSYHLPVCCCFSGEQRLEGGADGALYNRHHQPAGRGPQIWGRRQSQQVRMWIDTL